MCSGGGGDTRRGGRGGSGGRRDGLRLARVGLPGLRGQAPRGQPAEARGRHQGGRDRSGQRRSGRRAHHQGAGRRAQGAHRGRRRRPRRARPRASGRAGPAGPVGPAGPGFGASPSSATSSPPRPSTWASSESDLRTKLRDGQSLADVAKAQSKDLAGLEQAILDTAKARPRQGRGRQEAHPEPGRRHPRQASSRTSTTSPTRTLRFRGPGGPGGAPGRASAVRQGRRRRGEVPGAERGRRCATKLRGRPVAGRRGQGAGQGRRRACRTRSWPPQKAEPRQGGRRQEAHPEPGRRRSSAALKAHVADLVNAKPGDRSAARRAAGARDRASSSGPDASPRLDVSQAAGARYYAAMASTDIDRLSIDTIRTLSMDGVQKANSGHPGLPMAMAPAAYLLFARIMEHNPADPHWPDRDRFVLSAPATARCCCTRVLHLIGYDLSLDELKHFRQWGSLTPGPPRARPRPRHARRRGHHRAARARASPTASAWRWPSASCASTSAPRSRTTASSRSSPTATSWRASPPRPRRWPASSASGGSSTSTTTTTSRSTARRELSFDTEDVAKRFEAYGWHVQTVDDANDLERARGRDRRRPCARRSARRSSASSRSSAGPSPNKQGTSKAHGSPLGEDEVRADQGGPGLGSRPALRRARRRLRALRPASRAARALQAEWEQRFRVLARRRTPSSPTQWDAAWAGKPLPGVREALDGIDWEQGQARHALGRPEGDGRLRATTSRRWSAARPTSASRPRPSSPAATSAALHAAAAPARNVFFGVREHGMGGAVNGMAGHGGIVRPYGSTFLQFADYMRGSIRLVGADGPRRSRGSTRTTRSASARTARPTSPSSTSPRCARSPGSSVIRPGDANETARGVARRSSRTSTGRRRSILSRQDLPDPAPTPTSTASRRGAYVLRGDDDPEVAIVGTGSELSVAIGGGRAARPPTGIRARVVSMPSWELFAAQDDAYRDVGAAARRCPRSPSRPASRMGWERWVDRVGGDRPLRGQRARRPWSWRSSGSRRRTPRRPPASCSAR